MSATEKVRRLLDEREAEHEDNDAYPGVRFTHWRSRDGRGVTYEEWGDGTTLFSEFARVTTPEQAVAVTVGVEVCHMELLPDEPIASIQPMRCTACGHKTYAQLASFCPHCGAVVVE